MLKDSSVHTDCNFEYSRKNDLVVWALVGLKNINTALFIYYSTITAIYYNEKIFSETANFSKYLSP